jgi:hypothetical protein
MNEHKSEGYQVDVPNLEYRHLPVLQPGKIWREELEVIATFDEGIKRYVISRSRKKTNI